MSDILFRSMEFDRSSVNEENRTVELAFSSEQPVKRSFGVEVLSHRAEDVNLDFIQGGTAPLLFEHDAERQIGVVENATISADGVGRAVVRFGKSPFANEIFEDVKDNIRRNVSVGYVITNKTVEKRGADNLVRVAWMPKEISIVSVPADMTVGVGRSEEMAVEVESVETEKEQTRNIEMENQNVDIEVVRAEVQKSERTRVSEISALATRHGVQEMANQFIADGRGVDEFRAAVLDEMSRKQVKVSGSAEIGLSEKEVGEFSLARAVNALVTGDFDEAGFELEVSRAVAKKQGKIQTRSSIFLPAEYGTRAAGANAVLASANPALIDNRKIGFMDVLFNKTIAAQLGVQYIGGLSGTVDFPKFTNAAIARFVGEGADGTIDQVDSGKVSLAPRTLVALTELTRSMVANSVGIEARLRAQMEKAVAQALDKDVFAQVVADAGITWLTNPALGAYDYAELRAVVNALRVANSLNDNCRWAMDSAVANKFETTVKDTNTVGIYLRDDETGRMAGFGSEVSENVGNNLIFGDWSEVTVGTWGTLELSVDTSQQFASGGFLLRAITDVDAVVTRPEAFTGYKVVI